MQFENVAQAMKQLDELEATIAAYRHAMAVMGVDAATVAPEASAKYRGKTMGVLSGVVYGLIAKPENIELAAYVLDHADEIDAETKRRVELFKKSCEQLSRIPQEEYVEYRVLLNEADTVWRKAKAENDFDSFAPLLEKIVAFQKKFAVYFNIPYDTIKRWENPKSNPTEYVLDLLERVIDLEAENEKLREENEQLKYII